MNLIIKADDFGREDRIDAWERFLQSIQELQLSTAVGVVGSGLEFARRQGLRILSEARSSSVCIWNHGYTHSGEIDSQYTEFDNPKVDAQIRSIGQTQSLISDLLGVRPNVFCPAFNRYGQQTLEALKAFPEIDTCFFAPGYFTKHVQVLGTLPRIAFEDKRFQFQPIGHTQAVRLACSDQTTVMQIHPGKWDSRALADFERSMLFLSKQYKCQVFGMKNHA